MSEDIHRCIIDNVVIVIRSKSLIFSSAHIEQRRKSFAFQTIEIRGNTQMLARSRVRHHLNHIIC